MAANALMIWRAFMSSNHPVAKFTREAGWQLIGQAAMVAGAIVLAVIILKAIH